MFNFTLKCSKNVKYLQNLKNLRNLFSWVIFLIYRLEQSSYMSAPARNIFIDKSKVVHVRSSQEYIYRLEQSSTCPLQPGIYGLIFLPKLNKKTYYHNLLRKHLFSEQGSIDREH